MTQIKPLTTNCPNCQTEVIWSEDSPYRPFCSKRCQQVDFCGWAYEERNIPGSTDTDDLMSDDLIATNFSEKPSGLS